ncbi:AEC family transporter [Uliginosibacterium sediminicola]|uniref:AEC family transporter n=1 Tax=Uliginosibacterium sediminicola TaxID=2024550 RepID=A0ABU9YXF6_9RHOO
MDTFLLLLPDFALILLGYVLRRQAGFEEGFWQGLEKLVYYVLFPALLFYAVARTHIDLASMAPLFLCGLLCMLGGLLAGWLIQPLAGLDGLSFASRLQCAFRFNSYIAIAVAGKMYGAQGISMMGGLVGAMVPFANFAAVSLLVRQGEGRIWRELLRNPLIFATLAGIAFNLANLHLPVPLGQFLGRLSDASVALGLLAVGAALQGGSPGGHWLGAGWLLLVKLALMPILAWLLAGWLGLSGLARDVAVLFAALPTASSAYILTTRMGGDGAGVAWLISATTLLSMFSMSLWLAWLR